VEERERGGRGGRVRVREYILKRKGGERGKGVEERIRELQVERRDRIVKKGEGLREIGSIEEEGGFLEEGK
jgi:hypothetical protein